MTDRVAIRGESWQGYLANPSPRRSMGKIRVGFEFHLTDPVAGQIYVDYTIGEVKPFIEATKQIAMAKDLCKHHGVKSQGIRLRLLPESVERVEVAVAEIAAAYREEQDRIEVTGWHWALGGDSHRVLIFPDQEKNTEEIDQIRDVARSTRNFDDLIRPFSKKIDLEVRGLYTTGYWYAIPHDDLVRVIAEIRAEAAERRRKREAAEQEKFAAALRTEQETGIPAILSSRQVPCNDPDEECDMDQEITYVRPDGTTYTWRHHMVKADPEAPQRAVRRLEPCADTGCMFCRNSPDIDKRVCCFGLREIGCYRADDHWGATVRGLVRSTYAATYLNAPEDL